jgi:hypothetical protein
LRRYAFTEAVLMVESVDGILLRPKKRTDVKMSWADTAKAMAADAETWSDWEGVASDGLSDLDWESSCVAEKRDGYGKPQHPSSRRRT